MCIRDRYISEDNKAYSVDLNRVNIGRNLNEFYTIQVLESNDIPRGYWVSMRWYRLGETGETKLEGPLNSLAMAIKVFSDVVEQQIAVEGYTLYYSNEPSDVKAPAMAIEKAAQPSIPPQVADLVRILFARELLEGTIRQMGYDSVKIPLQHLTRNNIQRGYEALRILSQLLKGDQSPIATIQNICNDFYTYIPHDLRDKPISYILLDTPEKIVAKIELLETLEMSQIALRHIQEGGSNIQTIFSKLDCKIQPLSPLDQMHMFIQAYAANTTATALTSCSLDITDIFEVHRLQDDERFTNNIGNKYLLWYGTRTSNYAAILSQGFLLPSSEAPPEALPFGRGIYFSDMVAQAVRDCHPSQEQNIGFLLLCEVALGDMHVLQQPNANAGSSLPQDKSSVLGQGRVGPDASSLMEYEGLMIPIGEVKDSGFSPGPSLLFNQYVVYRPEQVRLRYMVKFTFRSLPSEGGKARPF
eukprot:TRINITY_DN2327_c0_g1_i1.p1 TRINITY_DN2327_c0_g1~~TRINITY_DN2327_c0_g1_i1.p1  ORF type:complete len:471 (+),score=40.54 TRINITY_DN2327_c0_g1_i1:65-1477(+)